MPLTKLFQKRNSLKDMSVVKLANEDIEKLNSIEISTQQDTQKLQSESKLSSNESSEFDLNIEEKIKNNSANEKYEFFEAEEGNDCSFSEESHAVEVRRRKSAPAVTPEKCKMPTFRSDSCNEYHRNPKATSSRRKCLSESRTYKRELDNEEHSKILSQLKESALEDIIGRYVNMCIKESILKAVRSLNVDDLCEDIADDFSNRNEIPESLDLGNSHRDVRKWTDSVAEYIEMEDDRSQCSAEEENKTGLHGEENELNDINAADIGKMQAPSLSGYSTDFEESLSLHSMDSEFKNLDSPNELSESQVNKFEENITQMKCNLDDNEIKLKDNNNSQDRLVSEVLNADELPVDDKESNHNCSIESESKSTLESAVLLKTDDSFQVNNEIKYGKIISKESEHLHKTINPGEIFCSTESDALNTTQSGYQGDLSDKLDPESDLIVMSPDNESYLLPADALTHRESNDSVLDSVENLPQQKLLQEEEKKVTWKVGYLHVKLPHKTRGKAHLKAWKKRCVSIQPDEFVNDPKNASLMISVYSAESGTARKHSASFWKSVSARKVVIYRSCSRSHRYAFTISEDNKVVIHLAGDSETASQEWMAAIRVVLWPPSPVMQLEKMLNGKEFEISIIDNDFAFRAGLLGMYGYLTVTRTKLILVHPHQGYVIQEWYLNTVDKFELMPQSKIEDVRKVLCMTTCSDSSTGKGDLLIFCTEAVAMLQAIATTIHQILTEHIKQEGGKYEKELAEIADWLVPASSNASGGDTSPEDYYKVPPRQVKSLLDIPNFIFDKPLTPIASVSCTEGESMEKSLAATKLNSTSASQDSGISTGNQATDFLNCSLTSFVVGAGGFPGKSSDSELSDSYTPPRSPEVRTKQS